MAGSLHLALVGALVLAVSGATQFLAVTWGAAPAPRRGPVVVQRWPVVAGAAPHVTAGREARVDPPMANVSSPMEEPLGRQLAITGRLVRERFDGCLGNHGSSLATWAVLRSADEEAGLSQRELAARMSIKSPTLVRHLDRMEHEGLIARARDEHDRRVVRVSLTPTGRRRYEALRGVAANLDAQLRSLLSPHEIETLEQVLPRIRERWHPDATKDGS